MDTDFDFLFEGLDAGERHARLRVLHALVTLYCGWDHPAKLALDAVIFDRRGAGRGAGAGRQAAGPDPAPAVVKLWRTNDEGVVKMKVCGQFM